MIFDLIFYCKTYDIIYAFKTVFLIALVGFFGFGIGLIVGYFCFGGDNGKRISSKKRKSTRNN